MSKPNFDKILGLHGISYPAPAKIRPNFHIRPYPAKAGYGRRISGRILPSLHASASLCNWARIHCFTNSVICTSLFQLACWNDVMIQQSGGSTIRSDIQHYPKWIKNLAPPPTSVPSERLFSVAGNVISEHSAPCKTELWEYWKTDILKIQCFSHIITEINNSVATIEYWLMNIDSLIWRCTMKYWWSPWCYCLLLCVSLLLHSYVMLCDVA